MCLPGSRNDYSPFNQWPCRQQIYNPSVRITRRSDRVTQAQCIDRRKPFARRPEVLTRASGRARSKSGKSEAHCDIPMRRWPRRDASIVSTLAGRAGALAHSRFSMTIMRPRRRAHGCESDLTASEPTAIAGLLFLVWNRSTDRLSGPGAPPAGDEQAAVRTERSSVSGRKPVRIS
jgi:hypothetical protein